MNLTGWSQSGNLFIKQSQQGVSLQAQMEAANVFTVQFGLGQPQSATPVFRKPMADISWSVAGNTIRRRVDVIDGLSFSGVGVHPKVRLFDGLDPSIGLGMDGVIYTGSISVAPGSRPSQNQPPVLAPETCTVGVGPAALYFRERTVPTMTSIIFPVPTDAGCISVNIGAVRNAFAGAIDATNFLIRQVDTAGILRSYIERDVFIPLSPGTSSIQVFNQSADNMMISCLFGIDG